MIRKLNQINRLVEKGVIAVVRHSSMDKAEELAVSLIQGGVTSLEITLDSPDALHVINHLSKKFGNHALIGAGTVLDGNSARLAIANGAEFIFSPSLHKDVIRTTLRYGKIVVPGAMTPTEMITAMEWGADLVKVFPSSTLGPQFIKDMKGPFPHIPVIPTGGINLDNVADFIQVGVEAVGVGGDLVNHKVIASGQFEKITVVAKKYIEKVQRARSQI